MIDRAPLEHEEALRLLKRVKLGDSQAQDILVEHNIALVKSIVKKYLNRGTEYDDLFQIGCVGLIKAVRNYDESFGVRFSTYAVPMIAGEVKRFLRDDGMIKVSRSLKELASQAMAAKERLSMASGGDVGIMEIAKELSREPEEIVMALDAVRPHTSIYEPIYADDADACVADRVASDEDEECEVVNKLLLKELLRVLAPRERQIIMLRFFGGKTQCQTAQIIGVSQVQVSRLESKILEKMRETAQSDTQTAG